MHPRRATWGLAALLLALVTPLPATAADASAAIILPEGRHRQGDPLIAWVVADSAALSAPSLEAVLLDVAGRVVSRERCFPAPALVDEPAEGLAPPSPGPSSVLSDRRLLGLVMALPLDLKPGEYRLQAGAASVSLAVQARIFPLETLRLDEANSILRSVPTKRKDEQARSLYALLCKVDDSGVFADGAAFQFPVEVGRRSAGFGDARRYEYTDGSFENSVHAGIDWAVVVGTPVSACARGRVVMAADRDVTGKTVVIEHLPGLYSLYFHLSAIVVEPGAIVERGERIALSGSTGLATGPHLHWELRARGEAVDPEYSLAAPLLDKNRVRAIMYGLIEGR